MNTVGILGFMIIDDYPFLDAVYQTVFTLTTVGYHETHPISEAGKVFVIMLILGGVLVWSYALGVTISVLVNDDLIGKIREAIMEDRIGKYRNHFIVVGYTNVARQLVKQFRRQEIPFVLIDNDEERVESALADGVNEVLSMDPFKNASFVHANVKEARGIISTFASDPDNITVVATGKIMEEEIGRELLMITVAAHSESRAKLLKIGADVVVLPNELTGQRIAATAVHPPNSEQHSFLDRVAFGEFLNLDIREIEIPQDSTLDGVAIRDSNIRAVIGAHILGVRRYRGRRLALMPNPDIILHARDTILIMGTLAQLEGLSDFLHKEPQS